MIKIAVIGAGLAGLSLAHLLRECVDITVFEKARGVSGRMSTRRADCYQFDHGAQYFTIRDKGFRQFLQPLKEQGLIQPWHARYIKFDGTNAVETKNWAKEDPRYVGVPAMNAIAKAFSDGLDIRLNTCIVSVQKQNDWQLKDSEGTCYDGFDWVISTAPAPQTADLLPVNFVHHSAIKAIEMQGSLALMLGFAEALPLDFEAAHVMNSDISWIAVNSAKPQRAADFTMVVHSSADYADQHIDGDRQAAMQHLCRETSLIIGHDVGQAAHMSLHAWRYAKNATIPDWAVYCDTDMRLAACGDWCEGGRVEGAFIAAQNLAETIKKTI